MIIGIAGKKQSGKDTAAQVFVARGFTLDSFAAPIRAFVAHIIGEPITEENKEAPIDWIDGKTPRQLMQTVGTEWGRSEHPEIWVRSLMRRVRPMAVVPDVRFENEARAIRDAGGIVIHVVRDGLPPRDRHASEQGIQWRDCDWIIENNGSLEQFLREVESAADAILEAHA